MHGFLIIDKPIGLSSAAIVGRVKWLTKSKCGHAGTLDPLATGVLPIALGEATKVVQFLSDANKEYEFEVTWGEERSTDDSEGEVVAKGQRDKVSEEEILQAMKNFMGEIEQIPPQYSAIKIDGKRAYDEARKGNVVEIKPRKVTVYNFELLNSATQQHSNLATFHMRCSKGTYVRSIARDMGRILGCYGYVSRLKRTSHGGFSEKDAITLEFLAEICQKDDVSAVLLPLEKVLDGIPALSLEADEEAKVRNGVAIFNRNNSTEKVIRLMRGEKLVALAKPLANPFSENSMLQPIRVFNH